jgi:predicted amidohydrolase
VYLAAVIQLNCGSDVEANFAAAELLVRRAAGYGARLIATPENTNFLGPHDEKVRRAEALDGPTCSRFSSLAARCGVHLLLGSFNERSSDPQRCYNTSVLFGPQGERLAAYRKVHLFDVDLGNGQAFTESDTVRGGRETVTVPTELGCLGLSICYDLRFPELYRTLVDAGAEVLLAPSAFTLTTGRDHWLPLLQARAIESQCYLLAPAQWGRHDDGGLRESYGRAAILDPWGQVLATAPDGCSLALAEIDTGGVAAARARIPALRHRRFQVSAKSDT